jgi:hypothetical protein
MPSQSFMRQSRRDHQNASQPQKLAWQNRSLEIPAAFHVFQRAMSVVARKMKRSEIQGEAISHQPSETPALE